MLQYPSPQDLKDFMTEFRTDGEDATYTVLPINGGEYDPSHPGVEANLDIQYAVTMTYPTPTFYYSTGGEETLPADSYVPWLAYVLEQKDVQRQRVRSSAGICRGRVRTVREAWHARRQRPLLAW